jgi:hypothetical protein
MNDITDLKQMYKKNGQNNININFSKIFKNLEGCYNDILSGKSNNQRDIGHVDKKIINYIRLSNNSPNDLKLLEESYRILKILKFINSQMIENKLTTIEDIMKYCKSNEDSCDKTTLCDKSLPSNKCIFSLKQARENPKKHLEQKNNSRHLDDVQDGLIKSVKHEIKKTDHHLKQKNIKSVKDEIKKTDRGSWKNKDPLSGKVFPEIDPLAGRNAMLQENPERATSLIFKENPSETRDFITSVKTPAYHLPSAHPYIFKKIPNETHNSHTSLPRETLYSTTSVKTPAHHNEIKTSTPDSDSAGGGIRASSSIFSKNNSKDSDVYGPPNRPNRSMALSAFDKSASYGSMAWRKIWDIVSFPVLDPDPVRNQELWDEIGEEKAARRYEALYAAIDRENDLNAQRLKEMRMQDQED